MILATFDPTLLTNGQWNVIVTAQDAGGHQTSQTVTYTVDGDLKVGNFSFTVLDLEIPVSGIPIRVTRTYDSRRRFEALDFGHGWSVGYQDVKIEESRIPGDGWALNEYPSGPLGLIPLFCVEPLGDPTVTVTLPDGQVERFHIRAAQPCWEATPVLDHQLTFEAADGTLSTLEDSSGAVTLRLVDDRLEFLGEGVPYDTDAYTLTTKAGYVYSLDQGFGITSVVDPNGNTLTYTDDGIFHSDGQSVLFNRDPEGRIASIIDPMNQEVATYHYDAAGDLKFAKDAAVIAAGADGTEYFYNSEHGLIEIIDPLGRSVIKNHYDEAGRLYAQEDGEGNFKYFDHDLSANSTVVTDLDGRTTVYNYDDEGHIIDEIQVIADGSYPADIVTHYTYDANGNQETRTLGDSTWTTLYSDRNDIEFVTDSEGNTVSCQDYNPRGQEGKITDERGHSYIMHYDLVGNLIQIDGPAVIDPDTGESTQTSAGNVINANGQVESTTDMRGHTITFTYYPDGHDWAGWKWTESSPITGTVTYTYDANGNVKSEARERTVAGVVTLETLFHDYDTQNRRIKTTYADGSYSATEYDLAGNIDRERDRFGQWTDYDTLNVIDGALATFDPTLLTNGLWDVVVTAQDTGGHQSSQRVTYTVDGDLKVGNFSFTVLDLEIPVSGIPIRVTRSYDSRRRFEALDFGHGWSVGYQDVKVEESRIPGEGWALNEYPRRPGPPGLHH